MRGDSIIAIRKTNLANTRAAVILVGILLFFATIYFYTTAAIVSELAVLLTDGLFTVAWVVSACALGAFLLRFFSVKTDLLLFIATAAGLGLGIFGLAALGLGLIGWLNRISSFALPIVSVILFIIDVRRRPIDFSDFRNWLLQPAGFGWLWLVPVISLATACVAASVMPGVLWKPLDPHPYDVISYHLQVPREWYEAGKISLLAHNVFSFFPFNVKMQYLLLMHALGGPWNAMYACQLLSVIYASLMVIAIASEGGVVGAAIASCVPWVIMLAGVAYVESALMLYTALAVIWALRRNSIAGVMAGFACGVKIIAVPMLLLAIPIAMLISFRKVFLSCIIFVVVGTLVFSPWLIRNVVWARNPIFPLAMKTIGQSHFSDEQVERFERA